MAARRHGARAGFVGALFCLSLLAPAPAGAELVVSQLIVELKVGGPKTADIEVFNNSEERSYATVEPREILNPGTAREEVRLSPDPTKLGLLTSPARFILEPNQRRTVRIASIGDASDRERVYRVTIKPVTGDVSSSETGLKLLVGYDLLVLVRPPAVRSAIRSERSGSQLILTNEGNASVELAEGKQCESSGKNCQTLPAKRLYAGASWNQQLPLSTNGEYRVRSAEGWSSLKF